MRYKVAKTVQRYKCQYKTSILEHGYKKHNFEEKILTKLYLK